MQKVTFKPKFDPPHVRLTIPLTTRRRRKSHTPEVIEEGLMRLLFNFQCLVIDRAGERRGMRAKLQGGDTVIIQRDTLDAKSVDRTVFANTCDEVLFVVHLREVVAHQISAEVDF